MVEFSEDENKVTTGGHRYRAEEGTPGKCDGCVMKERFGCRLTAEALRYSTMVGSCRCQPIWRKDGRHIIWVLDVEHCVPR